jgi:hypothetical protein
MAAESEIVAVDLVTAEVLLLEGAAEAAGELLAEVRRELLEAARLAGLRPGSAEGLPPSAESVALSRFRSAASAMVGDREGANALALAAVEQARQLGSTHDLALALVHQAWAGAGDVLAARKEAAGLLDGLGIVWLPELPRQARRDGVVVLPEQRRAEVTPV